MLTDYSLRVNQITAENLSALDKNQLIDLLQQQTTLLLAASTLFVPDREYIKVLIREVQDIQQAIQSRSSVNQHGE